MNDIPQQLVVQLTSMLIFFPPKCSHSDKCVLPSHSNVLMLVQQVCHATVSILFISASL